MDRLAREDQQTVAVVMAGAALSEEIEQTEQRREREREREKKWDARRVCTAHCALRTTTQSITRRNPLPTSEKPEDNMIT
jgi:GTP cyclohydrolase III